MCKVNTGIVTLIVNKYKSVHSCHTTLYTFVRQECTVLHHKSVHFRITVKHFFVFRFKLIAFFITIKPDIFIYTLHLVSIL